MFEVEFILKFKNEHFSKIIFESLMPEVLNPPSSSVYVYLTHLPPNVLLHFSSKNPLLLRAAINSFLRLILSLEETFKSLESI